MNGFMKWLSDSFAPKMEALFSRPWPNAVSSCMQKVIPFILTGSVIYLYNVAVSFFPQLPDLSPIANFSFGCISLIIAFMMANQCMEQLNHPFYVINAGLVGVCVMLMAVCPTDQGVEGGLATLMSCIGASGIAVGMIAGLYTAIIFNLWAKLHFLEGSSIPDFVSGWINTILPTLITLGLEMVLVYTLHVDIYNAILSVFNPIASIAQTLPGFLLCTMIPSIIYTMGISSWFFGSVTTPIYLAAIQANIDAVAAGGIATNIVTSESTFTLAFITMGGMCCTLGLNVLMCFSKSTKVKTLGRIFLAPSIFNINEPIMYSTVVFNPIFMLPAWICTFVSTVYVWVLMSTGLLNIPAQLLNVGQVPAPFISVLVTQDMRAILWWAILFVILIAIWFPFFKVWEREQLAQEQAAVDADEAGGEPALEA